VKLPRFRIVWGMAFVALVALNSGAIRAAFGFEPYVAQALILGALPMANVLAVGILIGQRRPGNRPFLLGFEAFGAIALTLSVAVACFFPDAVTLCLMVIEAILEGTIGRHHPFIFTPIEGFVAVVMLGLPQVAFALFGGSLSRRFRITRRPARTP
jgi:hypothetical protein